MGHTYYKKMKVLMRRIVTILEETVEVTLQPNSSSETENATPSSSNSFQELRDLDTCCVESNGQEIEEQDFVVDVETDIVDVLRFDNANFSSPKSRLKSPIPQQRLHSSDDHKSFNTCQHELNTDQEQVPMDSSEAVEAEITSSKVASPLERLSDLALGTRRDNTEKRSAAAASRNVSTASNEEAQEVTSPTARRILPKWQIVGGKSLATSASTTSKPLQRSVASLKPGSAPQKATLLTKEGPIDVCILKSKAIPCPRTGRYKCPVPNCLVDGRSRVGVAKHFRRDHKNYRSWRDVFIKKDAPDFILKEPALDSPDEMENQRDSNTNLGEMPTSSAEVYLTQAPEGSIPLPSTSSVIVPTGPQIIQVPIVTSPVVPYPPPSCSLIILQPQLPIISTMQQQPAMLPTNAMYLPSTNGMVHLNYASQLPTTLHHPQFPTILPNTFICTQDTSSGVAMPSHPQAFPVNFS